MPDKLTYSEIVKALKYCEDCSANINADILDLINRLQAENERLTRENIALNRCAIPSSGTILKVGKALLFAENEEDYDTTINAIKAEVYKECIEKAKKELIPFVTNVPDVCVVLNNLLKELVGDDNAE